MLNFVQSPKILAFIFVAISFSAHRLNAEDRKLNFLFIMADDLRTELRSYGSPAITPNLDRLAAKSTQFDRAYCQQAVCNPSRSSMLTGRRPDSLRLWNNGTHFREITPDVMTMPLWFKQHGYTTRCVGKIFHNWHTKEKGDRRSWSADEFLHYATHGHDAAEVIGEPPANLASSSPRSYTSVPLWECRDVPDNAYYDGRVAEEACRVINEIKEQSFFLAVGFWKPHAPFNAPKKYWDMYQRDEIPPVNKARPENAPELAFHDGRELRGSPPNQVTFTDDQIAEIRHGYFANITYMDAQVGKVLDTIEKNGLGSSTVITFISDHGYHLGEHDLWAKTSTFEYDARVPMLIHSPTIASHGSRTSSLAELVDLFPTLVELSGLPTPEGLEGVSQVPVLRDPTKSVKSAAYTQHPRPAYYDRNSGKPPQAMGVSVRTAYARYTEWRDWKTGEVLGMELYDEPQEPAELKNRAQDTTAESLRKESATLLNVQFPPRPYQF